MLILTAGHHAVRAGPPDALDDEIHTLTKGLHHELPCFPVSGLASACRDGVCRLDVLRRLEEGALDIRALLRRAPQLKALILAKTDIADHSLLQIGQMPRLTTLNLAGTKITDAGLRHLAQLKSLETLSLTETLITEEGIGYLSELKNLQNLHLGKTAMTEASRDSLELRHGLQHLKVPTSSDVDTDRPTRASPT